MIVFNGTCTVTTTVSTTSSTMRATEQVTTHSETTEQTSIQTTQKVTTEQATTYHETKEQPTVQTTQQDATTSQGQTTSRSKQMTALLTGISPTNKAEIQSSTNNNPGRRTITSSLRTSTPDPVLSQLDFQSNRAAVVIPAVAVVSAIAILLFAVLGFIVYKR